MTQSQTLTFTNRTTSPFRYDIVGSFLRPAELKAAREKFERQFREEHMIAQYKDVIKTVCNYGKDKLERN